MKISEKHNPPPPYSHKGFSLFLKKKDKAFTLAEVLITLTIIGVIAALTVPNLINKIQDHGFRSAFLKNYAVIQNAYAKSIRDGVPFWSPYTGSNWVCNPIYMNDSSLFKDYFKVVKVLRYYGTDNMAHFSKFYERSETQIRTNTFKYLNGEFINNFLPESGGITMKLADGTIISFCSKASFIWLVFVDVNGLKGPNTYGKDIYWLQASCTSEPNSCVLYPYGDIHTGFVNYTTSGGTHTMANTCKMNSTGDTCAFEIIKNRAYKIPNN